MAKRYGETVANHVEIIRRQVTAHPQTWFGIGGTDRLYTIKRKALDRLFKKRIVQWRAGTGRNHIEYKHR